MRNIWRDMCRTHVADWVTVLLLAIPIVAIALAPCTLSRHDVTTPVPTARNTPTSTGALRLLTEAVPFPTKEPLPTQEMLPTPTPEEVLLTRPLPDGVLAIAVPAGPGGNFSALALPDGVTVRTDGCSQTYGCSVWYNYYDAGSREVVLQGEESLRKLIHEHLHAHQHWSINGGADLPLSDYDLESWYSTSEGQSFMREVGVPDPWPWPEESTAATGLEAFAIAGSFWYTDAKVLYEVCLPCYNWARGNLP